MGGRRAADLTQLVGNAKPVQTAKRRLTSAVSTQDPQAIASATAGVLASSQVGTKWLRHGLKLSPYLAKHRQELLKQSPKDRNESIRQAWSAVKKKENIRTSPEVDSAVISATTAAFRKRE